MIANILISATDEKRAYPNWGSVNRELSDGKVWDTEWGFSGPSGKGTLALPV